MCMDRQTDRPEYPHPSHVCSKGNEVNPGHSLNMNLDM